MEIYRAKPEDWETILNIVRVTTSEVYPKYYPGDIVRFFLSYHSGENIRIALNDEKIMLVDVDGKIVGTGSLYKNEIKRMFILPHYQGKSYVTRLLQKLEELAFDDGYDSVVLDASWPGYDLYEKRGYAPLNYNKITTEKGQVLCYHQMQKLLIGKKHRKR